MIRLRFGAAQSPETSTNEMLDPNGKQMTNFTDLEKSIDNLYGPATTDVTNFPMSNAFGRANYNQIEHWWEYWIQLDRDPV